MDTEKAALVAETGKVALQSKADDTAQRKYEKCDLKIKKTGADAVKKAAVEASADCVGSLVTPTNVALLAAQKAETDQKKKYDAAVVAYDAEKVKHDA